MSSSNHETLDKCFRNLSSEARELYLGGSVPVISEVPTPLQFYREWICPNKPLVIQNALNHWKALAKWTPDYLRMQLANKEVSVAVTPNGYADAVCNNKFVMPEERTMKFGEFLDIIEMKKKCNGIFYVQKQNSNFTEEFSEVIDDAESDLAWATEAFGKPPDAVNFWMGDERAVTSMHKDHYENLYCVISGYKIFTLLPPTDQPFVPYETYQAAIYKENENGVFDIRDDFDTGLVPWIAIDPLKPDLQKYPQFKNIQPIQVKVCAGETLYLPSLWFHHVQQSHGCIAVNFWYDMEYDIKYNYYKFVENVLQTTEYY